MSNNHLIIGLGGTGGKIIRAFRKTIFQEFRDVNPTGVNLGYLYVDSSSEMMGPDDPTWRVLGKSVQLGNNSQVLITDASLSTRLANISNYPGISKWIGSQDEWGNILRGIIGVTLGGQKRRLGRFLFACKAVQFKQQLRSQVHELQGNGDISVTFHVCCGLAGGTGSGSLIDVLAQIRDTYNDAKTYRIVVYALLPDKFPQPNWDTGNYHANGYAALMELNALSVGAYQPYDVTGVKGRLNLQDPFNGCYVFSNENEKGMVVDVSNEIPEIVANFLYQKVITVKDVHWDTLRRMENAENGDGSPETPPNAAMGERSKRFLTFGIKRLAIPEQEIREYLTFTFARQAALQLQFNNWLDALSFADEPKNQSFREYVTQKDILERWLLSDEHLRLSVGVLPDEINNPRWKPISNTWQDVIPRFKTFIRDNDKGNPRSWLDKLAQLCEKRYTQEYRELGVARFYQTKEDDRQDHLREIRARIEKDLIEDWRNGVQSMSDIRRLLEALVASLQTRLTGVDENIVKATNNEESAAQRVAANSREWAQLNILTAALGGRDRLFDASANCLQEQYIHRTNIAAWKFARGLLKAVIGEMNSLQSEVDNSLRMLGEATAEFQHNIDIRCKDVGLKDLKQQLIKFYSPEAVQDFSRILIKNKDEQFKQTKAVRDDLLTPLGGSPTFAAFNQRVTKERFTDILEAQCERSVQTAHDILVSDTRDHKGRLLGDSIIERLYEQFGGNLEEVQRYVRELVNMAGNYVSFHPEEVNKAGDGIPAGMPTAVSSFTVIMPPSPARPDFYKALTGDFRTSTTVPMEFIPSKDIPSDFVKPNEITLISVTNLFPLRYLEQTSFLRQKYETRINAQDAVRAKLELFSEGDGSQYPPLFVPTGQELVSTGLPFLLLGKSLGIIQSAGAQGAKAASLVLVTKDKDGFDNPPLPLGASLVEASTTLDAGTVRTIRTAVEEVLAGKEFIAANHDDVQKAVLNEVNAVKAERGADDTYWHFVEAGKKAVSTIKGLA